jgi:hypothetical protein
MTKHVLPIKPTYIASWGMWECVRELVQNAKDEEQEHGSPMTIEHVDGWLHIANEGADLAISALLLGETSKAGKRGLRGQHGEGLDLALLCAARGDYEVKVFTKTEVWSPRIEYVKEYDARCLVVNTRKLVNPRTGVTVSLHIDKDTWLGLRSQFLFLDPPKEIIASDGGSLITDSNRKGQVFVKGIYVMTSHKSSYGFDLNDVALDRDRRVIGSFDLQWACAAIVKGALSRDPAAYAAPVMALLEDGAADVEFIGSQLDSAPGGRKALAEAFRNKHGQDAMPVGSMAESQQLAHHGIKGVVVNTATVRALAPEMGSYTDAAQKARMQPTKLYAWHELTEAEQAVYEDGMVRMAGIFGEHMPEACQLKICEFGDDSIEGSCCLSTSEIHVRRASLVDVYTLLEVLVHELAHASSQAGDGTMSHVRAIERIWRKLYEQADGCR